MHIFDVVVIGSGPVGLFSVFQAGMLGMKCAVIDSLEYPGGQCAALYPEKAIYDIPAHKVISGKDLTSNLLEQIERFGPTFYLGQTATHMHHDIDGRVIITTSTGSNIIGKTLVIAAGGGTFCPNRPPIDNIEKYEGKSIFYSIKNMEMFNGSVIAIAGGGDSAADWSIALSDIVSKIYLIHRRHNLRCLPDSMIKINSLADSGKIEIVIPYQIHNILPTNTSQMKLVIKHVDGEEKEILIDYLLPFFGLNMDLRYISSWGVDMHKKHISVDPRSMRTSVPGVYAVGDIAHYTGKLKLILVGFSECAVAMHDIYNIVFPGKALHFEYSTTKFAGS